jgi:hypothetical protein
MQTAAFVGFVVVRLHNNITFTNIKTNSLLGGGTF